MKEPEKKYNDEDNMLVNDLRSIVSKARSKAFAAVNYSLVERNWRIGQRIVEEEQNGTSRAEYGKHVIEVASAALTKEFGKGFSYTNIANYKRFYLTFSDLQILQTVSEEFKKQKHQTLSDESSLLPQKGQTPPAQFELRFLPWSHYERLIRVEDKKAREWYAKEAFEQGWSFRTLNRNINTLYYERLLMSTKKQPVVDEMQDKTKAYQQDKLEYIKSPVVLEFLGLPEDTSLAESKLETAIINNLEKFLMEMGKGYALVARQQHIRTEENDYYIDLVFYNYLIKSFILVDLKVNRITYQDVGQMDMYLQMYDKMKKGPDDNPTIGIILCTETDSDVARYSTLAKNDQMFAAKYKLYLPDKEDLRREIERQKELYLMAHPEENDKE
ncbi:MULTISPECIES: PDDEXK nuclease domain-containing protein [Segatella]|uniref:PDDEXK nuclease domain-containing protein n=3 Tax=Segatella copri TaxID=165179 RepID=A0AAW5I7P6_9BACT|nr:PDDEXK nuclease domain-containing protein [Segatella copri]MCP9546425.1 PDDEXK nuclease domain-containing protein [Segatella copri]MCP9548924.1 PDDEXK nuclease domain-containing protein [Segatella copri]MCP9555261.1 PDDEXK nuclease domain-containing protein [Segatella copri]MCP9569873.1 PDDEXK nuclease domain-containing protein [Segatella copri]